MVSMLQKVLHLCFKAVLHVLRNEREKASFVKEKTLTNQKFTEESNQLGSLADHAISAKRPNNTSFS